MIEKILNILSNNAFTLKGFVSDPLQYESTLSVISNILGFIMLMILIKIWYNNINGKSNWHGGSTRTWWWFWVILITPIVLLIIWLFSYITFAAECMFVIYWIIYFIDNPEKVHDWWYSTKLGFWICDMQGKVEPEENTYKSKFIKL